VALRSAERARLHDHVDVLGRRRARPDSSGRHDHGKVALARRSRPVATCLAHQPSASRATRPSASTRTLWRWPGWHHYRTPWVALPSDRRLEINSGSRPAHDRQDRDMNCICAAHVPFLLILDTCVRAGVAAGPPPVAWHPIGTVLSGTGVPVRRGRPPAQPRDTAVNPTRPPPQVRDRWERGRHAELQSMRRCSPPRVGNGAPRRPFDDRDRVPRNASIHPHARDRRERARWKIEAR
jgi:hypothetical protein